MGAKAALTPREKQERAHRSLSLLNFAAFGAILVMDWADLPLVKQIGFGIGSLGNLAGFLFWKRWEKHIYSVIYALDAVLYAAKGYGLHEHGSRRAFLFYYLIAGVYLILSVFGKRIGPRARRNQAAR